MTHTPRIAGYRRTPGLLAVALMLALPVAAGAAGSDEEQRDSMQRMIVAEAVRNSVVPPPLALAVAREESNFTARVVGASGAVGVMQILPDTAAQEFGVDADELWDPTTNVRLGLHYLNRLYWRYGQDWELALSHYRGGPLRKDAGLYVPHDYTRAYVDQVLLWWWRYRSDPVVHDWMREAYGWPRFGGRRYDDASDYSRFDDDPPKRFPQGPWTAVTGDRFR